MSLQLSAQANGVPVLNFGSGAVPSDSFRRGGMALSADYQIYAAVSGTVSTYTQGIPFDSNGRVLAAFNPVATYSNGVPLDSSGFLCAGGVVTATWSSGVPFASDGSVSGWNPLYLFADGATEGFWSDLTTGLYQDTAGTTPISAYGQGIGLVVRQAGSVNLLQTVGTAKPTYGRMPRGEQVRNLVSNNVMAGAAIGTPGTLPTTWGKTGASWANQQVVAIGETGGIPYIDLRIFGTSDSTGGVFIQLMDALSFGAGGAWNLSVYAALVGGSLANLSDIVLRNNAEGSGVAIAQSAEFERYDIGYATTAGNTRAILRFNALGTGLPVDFTIRLGGQQVSMGETAQPLQLVDGPYNVTQSGIPDVPIAFFDLADDAWDSASLAAGTYTVIAVGELGCYIDEITHAGGTWTYGPTTWTGGPTGAITNLVGNRLLALGIVEGTLTAQERLQVGRWAIAAKGCPGVWEAGGEMFRDPSFDDAGVWAGSGITSGEMVVSGGVLTITNLSVASAAVDNAISPAIVAGEMYIANFVIDSTDGGNLRFQASSYLGTSFTTTGTKRAVIAATSASTFLGLQGSTVGLDAVVSSISCKQLTLNPSP